MTEQTQQTPQLVLSNNRPTTLIKDLPDYPGSEIEVYGRLSVGDIYDANGSDIKMVASAIKQWNFKNEAGELLPVNEDALRNMIFTSFEVLLAGIQKFAEGQKKTDNNNTNGQ